MFLPEYRNVPGMVATSLPISSVMVIPPWIHAVPVLGGNVSGTEAT